MGQVLLIHGAGASGLSWQTFAARIGRNTSVFEYDATRPIEQIVGAALAHAETLEGPIIVIGHSFGGIIAWHVAKSSRKVAAGISVATPWGGSQWAEIVQFVTSITGNWFFPNLARHQKRLIEPRSVEPPVRWLNVVTRKGIFKNPPNDGVVLVKSQEELAGGTLARLSFSHTEVLQTPELVATVQRFLQHHDL